MDGTRGEDDFPAGVDGGAVDEGHACGLLFGAGLLEVDLDHLGAGEDPKIGARKGERGVGAVGSRVVRRVNVAGLV